MKKINLFSRLWSSGGNSQSTDVSHDCRLTVGSPSGLDAKWKQNPFMRFAVVLTLIFTIGSGNAWGAVTALTIPKAWGTSDGKNAYTEALGCSNTSCLGSDYSSAPKLKFDNQGDYIIIQIASAPAYVTFNIKGNPGSGSWGGTFKVQESSNGSTYTDAASYTSLSSSSTSKTVSLSSTTRYIKFNFVTKSNGNVGLGGVTIKARTTVTLHKNGGSANGSAVIAYNATAKESLSAPTYDASHEIEGYYAEAGCSTKVLNSDGSFAASNVSGWITSSKWSKDAATATLYAKWNSTGTSVTLSKAATTNGSFKLSSSNTGTPEINSVSTAGASGTVYVVGTPSTGYYVSNVTQSGASAAPTITEVSENVWSVVYGSSTTGTSTITVTFSPIWALKGSFDSWGDGYLMSGTGTVSVTRTLTANTRYEFKIYNKGTAYGNTGAIVHSVSGWTFATDKDNCILYTGPAGSYTFSINTSTKAASVTYPSVDHPNANYVYIKKGAGWSDARIYNYQSGSDSKMSDWGGSPILASCEICDETYYYGAAYFNKIIFRDGGSNQSNEVSLDRGKWLDETTHADSWSTFDKYTISYDKGTGTGGPMSSHTDLCPGSNQALCANAFTKDHYHFTGWIADRDVTINSATVTQGTLITGTPTIENIQHDIALTAQWEADSYSVTATLTNLTPNNAFPSSFTYTGSSTTDLNRTLNAATGYNRPTSITVTMGGSTLTKDTHYTYNNSTGAFAFTAVITGNVVITASGVAKTYSNTLDREGGTTGSESVTTTYNSSTLTSYTAPTKTGYTFGGYWSADNGTGTEVIDTNGALKTSVTIDAVAWTDANGKWVKDGAVTLYAKWTANTYTVAFDKNHASATGTMSNQTGFTYGVGKALSTCTFGAPTHKYFYGWHRTKAQADAGNREYTDGQSVTDVTATNGATVTLYAVWKDHTYTNYRTLCADQFDIVLDDGLVATTNNGSAKVANNGTTITNIVAPTKNGYDVDYYCTNSGLGTQIATAAGALSASVSTWTDGTGKWILGTGATFYTKWTAHEYTITYNMNGGSGATNTTYTIESSAITLPTAGAMSRNGYDFTAWYANSDLSTGGVQTTIPAGSTGDKEYWAKWTAKQFTVTLNANGGVDGATTSVTATFNEAMPTIAAANLPTRDGYRFDGFYTGKTDGTKYYNADGTSAKAYAKYSSDPSAHVLYAHWKAQTKFSVDGVVDPSLTIDDNAAMPSATVPVACGDCWGFLGWSEDPDESSAIDYAAGATHTFGTPTTLYAVFGKVEYKWVTNLSDLVNNEYYILTMLDDEDNERALANSVTNTKYATATDISSNLKENSSGFYIYNPDPSIVWKFTGTTSSGRLYNESASKYLDLSSTSNAVLQASTSDNLNFTKFNSTLFNIASTSQTSQFLYMYTNPFWGVDDDHDGYASCYIYKRQPSTVTTSPSCDTYTIAWKVGSSNATGSPTTSTNTCTGIEDLPNTPADNSLACATKFMGWSESTLVGPGKAEPVDLFTTVGGAPKIDDNKEFHAVFATASIGESTSTLSQTYNTVTLGTNYNDDGSDDFTLTDSEGNSISMERENMIEGSYSSDHYIQIRNASGAGFWNATPIPGAITNITVNAYSANSFKLYVGTSKKGTTEEKTIASTTQQSFNFDAEDGLNYFYFASNSAAGQITSYTITYKAIEYSDYMTSCCNELITLSDPSIDGSGCTITFDKSSPVATCEGGVNVEATVTVTPGFRVTALSFSGGDVVIDPSISTPLTSSQTYTLSFAQHTTATLTTTATVEALRDEYYDYMHDNVKKYNKDGNYNTVPTLSSKPAADDSGCKDDHYKFKGWVVEDEINENGTLKDGYTLILGGTTGKYATGKKYYAVWAEEE